MELFVPSKFPEINSLFNREWEKVFNLRGLSCLSAKLKSSHCFRWVQYATQWTYCKLRLYYYINILMCWYLVVMYHFIQSWGYRSVKFYSCSLGIFPSKPHAHTMYLSSEGKTTRFTIFLQYLTFLSCSMNQIYHLDLLETFIWDTHSLHSFVFKFKYPTRLRAIIITYVMWEFTLDVSKGHTMCCFGCTAHCAHYVLLYGVNTW